MSARNKQRSRWTALQSHKCVPASLLLRRKCLRLRQRPEQNRKNARKQWIFLTVMGKFFLLSVSAERQFQENDSKEPKILLRPLVFHFART